ncbi:hypothetical protein L0Y59_02870 [Candidatus Uhrbacteria bacterium]|nr:hypothetical protein [Candidatus Uhrbacteria bacterium]
MRGILATILSVISGLVASGCAATCPCPQQVEDQVKVVEIRFLSPRQDRPVPVATTGPEPLRGDVVDLSTVAMPPCSSGACRHLTERGMHWHRHLDVPEVGDVDCPLDRACMKDLFRRTDNERTGRDDGDCEVLSLCRKLIPREERPSPYDEGI